MVLEKVVTAIEPAAPVLRYQGREWFAPAADYAATRAIVENSQIRDIDNDLRKFRAERGGWGIQLEREKKDAKARDLIRQQIERVDHSITELEAQLKRLKEK